jgi:hypothetical protein
MKVIIPTNVEEFITLGNNIVKKELALGTKSNLTPAELTELQQKLADATDANNKQKELTKEAKELTLTRDIALGTTKKSRVNEPGNAKFLITGLRDVLLGKNKVNPKVLGEWGFDVVEDSGGGSNKKPPVK